MSERDELAALVNRAMRSAAGGDAVSGRVIADAILAAGWRPPIRWTPRVRHDVRVSSVRVESSPSSATVDAPERHFARCACGWQSLTVTQEATAYLAGQAHLADPDAGRSW